MSVEPVAWCRKAPDRLAGGTTSGDCVGENVIVPCPLFKCPHQRRRSNMLAGVMVKPAHNKVTLIVKFRGAFLQNCKSPRHERLIESDTDPGSLLVDHEIDKGFESFDVVKRFTGFVGDGRETVVDERTVANNLGYGGETEDVHVETSIL